MPGETVLIQGTGGVSLFALQFARHSACAPSSPRAATRSLSGQKARRLAVINYRTQPAWDEAARKLTDGLGVNHILEMVGGDNARRSFDALAASGRLSVIGLLGAWSYVSDVPFLRNRITVQGISIGHRRRSSG